MQQPVFFSTIIPTIGRASLEKTVLSVLNQDFNLAPCEVIVVNDSGKPILPADWQKSDHVRIIETQKRERSVARNTGAAIARGQYLHFLDDDDWLVPGALEAMWNLAQKSEADWLYGSTQILDRKGQVYEKIDHGLNGNGFIQVMAGEWIPLQSSWIKTKAFYQVGGFNTLLTGPEDIDLLKRIVLFGNVAGSSELVSCVKIGFAGSTTDQSRLPAQRHQARESLLEESGCFQRLLDSVNSSPSHKAFWHGRLARIYLTSMVWNLKRRRLFTATSRLLFAVTCIICAWKYIVASDYWKAISKPYQMGGLQISTLK
jgi:glycosyltransferase involved in cell wall biosynthesis